LQELNATFALEFLEQSGEKQKSRHNSIRSRNARIAAIRAFMHYAGTKETTA
jgi:integrase/recombinase XerD